jgi:hypothetical protein
MAPDRTSTPEPDKGTVDDPLAGLRKLAAVAKDLGVNDIASFTDALETARSEGRGPELFKSLKGLVDQFAGQGDNPRSFGELGARLRALVSGPETVADVRGKVEMALLRRIEELTAAAPADQVLELATAYARVNSARVGAPDAGSELGRNAAHPGD